MQAGSAGTAACSVRPPLGCPRLWLGCALGGEGLWEPLRLTGGALACPICHRAMRNDENNSNPHKVLSMRGQQIGPGRTVPLATSAFAFPGWLCRTYHQKPVAPDEGSQQEGEHVSVWH